MPLGDLIKPTDKEGYDEETLKDMPAYPGLTLTSHVLLKNIQVPLKSKKEKGTG